MDIAVGGHQKRTGKRWIRLQHWVLDALEMLADQCQSGVGTESMAVYCQ